jgi:hypothetical protein
MRLWDTAAVCQHAGTCNISESSSCCKEFCLLHCFVTVIITTHDDDTEEEFEDE